MWVYKTIFTFWLSSQASWSPHIIFLIEMIQAKAKISKLPQFIRNKINFSFCFFEEKSNNDVRVFLNFSFTHPRQGIESRAEMIYADNNYQLPSIFIYIKIYRSCIKLDNTQRWYLTNWAGPRWQNIYTFHSWWIGASP